MFTNVMSRFTSFDNFQIKTSSTNQIVCEASINVGAFSAASEKDVKVWIVVAEWWGEWRTTKR